MIIPILSEEELRRFKKWGIKYNHPMNFRHRFALLPLLLGLLACRPVWTVGWTEFFILVAIMLLVVGPSLWRFSQRYRKFRQHEEQKEKRE